MNEDEARVELIDSISDDDGLYSLGWYLAWWPHETTATLDGIFTADELEAIAWWMRNKVKLAPPCSPGEK